ncbi:MAG: acyl-ACP--UDP-N-acetylglucosamine O-acyltransferase [Desulfurellaceae bacterium]|nr:acyl-ACP--UDP-N-acetylglucosamine O-acyltransferase [Desulfurellaceae bacterium]
MSTETAIHPSAVIAPGAELDHGVRVGPYAVIGQQVHIGRDSSIGPHSVVEGHTTIGCENQIFQFASVGAIPQDKKYQGEDSRLTIGDRNTIREFATLNTGTTGGGLVTRIGNDNLFMVYSHVGHDCQIGNNVILANCATLAGHVLLEDYVGVGGLAAIHQFTRVGESAYLGGGAMVSLDVPPYCVAQGDRARLFGLNLIGLKRRGFGEEQLNALKKAYRTLFAEGLTLKEAADRTRQEQASSPEVVHLTDFIASSQRGICRPRRNAGQESEDDLG